MTDNRNISAMMKSLKIKITRLLTPLLSLIPEHDDHPDIAWLCKWLTQSEHSLGDVEHVLIFMSRAVAEVLAAHCCVLESKSEELVWGMMPVFEEAYKMQVNIEPASNRFISWIISVVEDPELCPNPNLRFKMFLLYKMFIKIDNGNRERALESLMSAFSSLDMYRECDILIETEYIVSCLELLYPLSGQFDHEVCEKLSNHRNMKQQILLRDISHEHSMGLKALTLPRELLGLNALMTYISYKASKAYKVFQEEPDNWNHIEKLDKLTIELNNIVFNMHPALQEPELLDITCECIMNFIEGVVLAKWTKISNTFRDNDDSHLSELDSIDSIDSVLICFIDVTDGGYILGNVINEIIRRFKGRICKMRSRISKEFVDVSPLISNVIFNDKY